MAKVKIIIKGIAMSYHKGDGIWKFIFPFEEGHEKHCHNLKFTGVDGKAVPLAQAGRKVVITAVNPKSEFGIGAGYEEFLDLTADYSHENGILKKDKWENQSVFMSIENAVFSLHERTKSRYSLEINGKTTKESDYIGYSGIAEIEAERVNVEISGLDIVSIDKDATIIFDNTCQEKRERDNADFQMLYYAVEDKSAAGKEFTLKRDSRDMPKGFDTALVIMDNAKPGEIGLPCNKVRVSEPDDLP
jgi:hypothetical protein